MQMSANFFFYNSNTGCAQIQSVTIDGLYSVHIYPETIGKGFNIVETFEFERDHYVLLHNVCTQHCIAGQTLNAHITT